MEAVDIFVTSPETGHRQLVAEVKSRAEAMARASDTVTHYMFRMGIPCGLVVAGNVMRVFRSTYETSDVSSVRQVAECTTDGIRELEPPNAVDAASPRAALDFEARVQEWLESIQNPWRVHDLPEPVRSVVEEHVAPWVEKGRVHASAPRDRR